MEHTFTSMDQNIMGNGRMINSKAEEFKHGKMAHYMKGNISTVKKMGKEYLNGKMGRNM